MSWSCPICYEEKVLPMIFNCGHTICYNCKNQSKCPLCSTEIISCIQNFALNEIVKAEIPAGYQAVQYKSKNNTRINGSTGDLGPNGDVGPTGSNYSLTGPNYHSLTGPNYHSLTGPNECSCPTCLNKNLLWINNQEILRKSGRINMGNYSEKAIDFDKEDDNSFFRHILRNGKIQNKEELTRLKKLNLYNFVMDHWKEEDIILKKKTERICFGLEEENKKDDRIKSAVESLISRSKIFNLFV